MDESNSGWFVKQLGGVIKKLSVMATSILVVQQLRGCPTEAVNWDNFKYHEAYTYLILQPHKANSDTNNTRYKVSLPEDGVLFDIQQSGALSSLRPMWGTEVETIHLDSRYHIKIQKT